MTPQLADYDFVICNTSAGKDSQTALRYVMQQAEKEGYPKSRIIAAHADLGRIEWPGAKELAKHQADLHEIQFWAMARPQGDLLQHILDRTMFPDSQNRFCTAQHKRDQITKLFTQVTATLNSDKQTRILNVMGMRAEESKNRAKLKPFHQNTRASNGKRHVDNWLPIHGWKIGDVWKDIKASGVPHHRAYDLGMPRLSCVFCFFANKQALMIAARHNPELLQQYVDVEFATGHDFKHKFPLHAVQEAIAAGEDWGPAKDWTM